LLIHFRMPAMRFDKYLNKGKEKKQSFIIVVEKN
jgi:hypothetical protein